MKINEITQKRIVEFSNFLRNSNLTIPDRDVIRVFSTKYKTKLNVGELSTLLTLLETNGLLNKEKSINKKPNFYAEKHKLFLD